MKSGFGSERTLYHDSPPNEFGGAAATEDETARIHVETPGVPERERESAKAQTTVIGSGAVVKGDITGAGSVLIEGTVEGAIRLELDRVTIGKSGKVDANISAREVVVIGAVRGNVIASESVYIRMEGSLTGDVSTKRINLEDGAFFKGNISVRRTEPAERFQAS